MITVNSINVQTSGNGAPERIYFMHVSIDGAPETCQRITPAVYEAMREQVTDNDYQDGPEYVEFKPALVWQFGRDNGVGQ